MKRWRACSSLFANLRAIFHKRASPQGLESVPPFSKSELAEIVRQSLESRDPDRYPVLAPEGYKPKDGEPHSVFSIPMSGIRFVYLWIPKEQCSQEMACSETPHDPPPLSFGSSCSKHIMIRS